MPIFAAVEYTRLDSGIRGLELRVGLAVIYSTLIKSTNYPNLPFQPFNSDYLTLEIVPHHAVVPPKWCFP